MSQVRESDPSGLNQHQAGAKLDAGKVDMSLLTLWPRALREVCRVGTLGASKYSRGGFLSVSNGVIRYTAAMLRHLFKEEQTYDDDPYYDTEAGAAWKGTIRHDAQVAWNALSRLEVKLREEEDEEQKRRVERDRAVGQAAALQQSYTDVNGGRVAYGPGPNSEVRGVGQSSGLGDTSHWGGSPGSEGSLA